MTTGKATGSMPVSSRPETSVLLAFALSVLFGGANAVAVRFTVDELTPFWGATLRFAAAATIFIVIMLVRRIAVPRGRVLWGVLLYGLLNFGISFALIYVAISRVTAGFTMIILALTPLLTFLLAVVHRLEPFNWRALLAALLAVVGIGIAFAGQAGAGETPLWAVLFIAGGAACFAEATVVMKMLPHVSPVAANGIGMGVATLFLAVLSLIAGESWVLPQQTQTWLAILFLIIFGSVILFYMLVYVIQHWTATASSYMLVLAPFVTVPLGAWLAGETITAGLVVGGIVVLASVWFGVLAQPKPPADGQVIVPTTGC